MTHSILYYLYQYVKFGRYTTYFLILLGLVIAGRSFFRIRWPLSRRLTLVLIFLVGFLLRVGWLGFSSHTPMTQWNTVSLQENDLINIHAIELARDGKWFLNEDGSPSGRRPIGYPVFLAVFYKVFGPHLAVAWSVNLCLFLLSLYFLYKMTQKILGDPPALVASFLFAIYPMSIYSVKLLTDENLFLPLWYGGLYLLFQFLDGSRIRWSWLWFGLIFGYAAMTRTHVIFMPLACGLAYWLLKKPVKDVLFRILLIALVMQLINLPWVVRNYKAWGVPVVYTATGFFVYSQMNATAGPEGGGHIPVEGEPGYSPQYGSAAKTKNEGLMHQAATKAMTQWITQNPAAFLNLGTARLLDFMNFNRKSGVWAIWHQFYPGTFDPARPLSERTRKLLQELAFSFYYMVFFSWLFGLILIARRWKTLPQVSKNCLWVLGSCFLFWWLEHMIIYPDRKYRFPLEPLMLMASAYFFVNVRWPDVLSRVFSRILHRKPKVLASHG